MDIAQLEKVMEMISSLGEGATDAFTWYLIVDIIKSVLKDCLFCGTFVTAVVLGYKLALAAMKDKIGEQFRTAAGVISPWNKSEIEAAKTILAENKNRIRGA